MSFGFSIGDFIAVIELANSIRKDFSGAPQQYQNIAEEVKNLTSILQDIDTFAEGNDITSQEATLCSITQNCYTILKQIKSILSKYSSLEPKDIEDRAPTRVGESNHEGEPVQGKTPVQEQKDAHTKRNIFKGKLRRVWDRVKFEPDEIRDFRQQISSNVSLLNAAMGSITRDNVVKLVVQQENHSILDWLANSDYAAQQANNINLRVEDTGRWFLESPEYHEWMSSSTILFLQGIPGAGKTILSSAIVGHLQQKCLQDSEIRLCYFYCDYNRAEKLDDIMLKLLRQLAEASDILPSQIKELYLKHQAHRTRPDLNDIRKALYGVSKVVRLYLVIDALDECQTSNGCQGRFITEILEMQKAGTHILVTSRPIPQILDKFRACDLTKIEVVASKDDVRRYIDMHIEELPLFVIESSELQITIKDSIVEATEGMFLLAKLHFESLKGTTTKKNLRGILRSFRQGKNSYTEAYNKTMEAISRQHPDQRDLAFEAIGWIVYAQRPLKAAELLHALAIEVGEPEFDEENIPDLREVISRCCGLIIKETETETMRLIHYTTQEYFEGDGSSWLQGVHAEMARSCIAYLSLDSFRTGRAPVQVGFPSSLAGRCEVFSFYSYASCFWGFHVTSKLDYVAVQHLLNLPQNLEATIQALEKSNMRFAFHFDIESKWTGLHLVTYFGLLDLVPYALQTWDIQCADSTGQTALMLAAQCGHEAVARLLIDRGADLEAVDHTPSGALWIANLHQRPAVSRLLIERGARINVEAPQMNPLIAASGSNMADIVQLLLEKGAYVNAIDPDKMTALIQACHTGDDETVRLLIEYGAEVNASDQFGHTPLMGTVARCSLDVVELLIDHGAQVNAANRSESTALVYSCMGNREAITRLLLDRGAQVNIDYLVPRRSALTMASLGSSKTIVQLLVNSGARLEEVDYYGWTALRYASSIGRSTIVELLIDKGAQFDNTDRDDRTPLMEAAKGPYDDVVKLLIENGARLDHTDRVGQTALMKAVKYSGNHAVIKLLVENRAQLDLIDDEGHTALMLAVEQGKKEAIKLLVKNGAQLDLVDEKGLTALMKAVIWRSNRDTIKLLIESGARLDLVDKMGRTALMLAKEYGDWEVLKLLFMSDTQSNSSNAKEDSQEEG